MIWIFCVTKGVYFSVFYFDDSQWSQFFRKNILFCLGVKLCFDFYILMRDLEILSVYKSTNCKFLFPKVVEFISHIFLTKYKFKTPTSSLAVEKESVFRKRVDFWLRNKFWHRHYKICTIIFRIDEWFEIHKWGTFTKEE